MKKISLFVSIMLMVFAFNVNAETVITSNACAGCTAVYQVGQKVDLTATPEPDSYLVGWRSNYCWGTGHCIFTITSAMPTEIIIDSIFEKIETQNLYINVHGKTGCKVISTPAGIDCTTSTPLPVGGFCQAAFPRGSKVTLTVTGGTPNWRGFTGCNVTAASCTVTMTASKAGVVQFK